MKSNLQSKGACQPRATGKAQGESKRPARREWVAVLLLTLATLGCLVPFLNKPFHIDDPLFIWSGRHILSHPLDFYGFNVNWDGHPAPMSTITQNPPLAAYYLAGAGGLLGWSEAALHVAFLLPALAVILGTYFLAKRLSPHPPAAALAAVCSPVFIVSGSSVMCDTMMLGFWVWAVYFWLEGLARQSHVRLGLAAVLITLASLTKYFGMCLVPLLLVYAALERRRAGSWLAWLGLPVAGMALFQWWTQRLYGKGLLFNAAAYATNLRVGGALPQKILAGLAFSGGCLILVLFAAPLLWGKRGLAIGGVTALIIGLALMFSKKAGVFPLADEHGMKWLYILQLALFATGGIGVLSLAGADLLKQRNPASALLFLWVMGVFLFTCVVNWTVSGRNILPMLPAVACLLLRRLEGRQAKPARVRWLAVPAGLSLAVAILVAQADYTFAQSARNAAQSLHQKLMADSGTVWFEGHWGFQYYMEQLGAKAINRAAIEFSKNDHVIFPLNNSYLFPLPGNLMTQEFSWQVPASPWLGILKGQAGAGYYSDGWGPLPFVWGRVSPEIYVVLRVR